MTDIAYVPSRLKFEIKEYERVDINPLKDYLKISSFYVSKRKGIPVKEARKLVKEANKDRFRDPMVRCYLKDRVTYDKHNVTMPLTEYLEGTQRNNEIISPSGTTYVAKDVERSVTSTMMNTNKKKRGILKKKAFELEAKGDLEGYAIYNRGQINTKLANNSLSGVVSIMSSVLYTPSYHPTLTSTTRMITSISNGVIERLLGDRRHYYSYEAAIRDISTICSNEDRVSAVREVVSEWSLKVPSAEEMYSEVIKSCTQYWKDRKALKKLSEFIRKLTDDERCAYCYTGSFWFLALYNDELIRTMFDELLSEPPLYTGEDVYEKAEGYDEYQISLAAHFLTEELAGKGTRYSKMEESLVRKVVTVVENISSVLFKYMSLLRGVLSSTLLPSNTANMKEALRESTLMSDTDSVAMWLGRYSKWYTGEDKMGPKEIALVGFMAYISVMTVDHSLRIMSRNMGLSDEDMNILQMKSEFTWLSMGTVNLTKHYCSAVKIVEGNVKKALGLETKGAHLKSASLPLEVTEDADNLMLEILTTVAEGKKVDVVTILERVSSMEQRIEDAIMAGNTSVLKTIDINPTASYSDEDVTSNNSKHHEYWKIVFEKMLGYPVETPYRACKVKTVFKNKSQWREYLESHKDQEYAKNLAYFIENYTKAAFPKLFYLPIEYTDSKGLPDYVKETADTEHIITDIANIYYIILSILGYNKPPERTVKSLRHIWGRGETS